MFSNTIAAVRRYEWGPNGVGRGLLVDFGFGDVLKEMDKRLGPGAVTLLLACILVGGVFWVISQVLTISGIVESYIADKHPAFVLLRFAIGAPVLFVCAWASTSYFTHRSRKQLRDQAQRSMDECKATHKVCEEWMEKIKKLSEDQRTNNG